LNIYAYFVARFVVESRTWGERERMAKEIYGLVHKENSVRDKEEISNRSPILGFAGTAVRITPFSS